jgi:allophanate hydrolase
LNLSNVVDIAYPIGSVQVPGGEHPVLLLNDGVTGGGFAIIGTVVRADMDVAGQLKPGDRVVFESIGIREALEIRKAKADKISAIKEATRYPF